MKDNKKRHLLKSITIMDKSYGKSVLENLVKTIAIKRAIDKV